MAVTLAQCAQFGVLTHWIAADAMLLIVAWILGTTKYNVPLIQSIGVVVLLVLLQHAIDGCQRRVLSSFTHLFVSFVFVQIAAIAELSLLARWMHNDKAVFCLLVACCVWQHIVLFMAHFKP
jgi:hypothetical protein